MNKLLLTLALLSALLTGAHAGINETEADTLVVSDQVFIDAKDWEGRETLYTSVDAKALALSIITDSETNVLIFNEWHVVGQVAAHLWRVGLDDGIEATLRASLPVTIASELPRNSNNVATVLRKFYYTDAEFLASGTDGVVITDTGYYFQRKVWVNDVLKAQYASNCFEAHADDGRADKGWKKFVLAYCKTLSKVDAKANFQEVKDALTFMERTPEQDAWYTTVSASIMGIKLD
jgi:hypothetical protein